jgi:hypothetical protein
MKTKNTISIGIAALMTVFLSFSMVANTHGENENKNAENNKASAVDVQVNTEQGSTHLLTEMNPGEPMGSSAKELFNVPDPFIQSTEIFYILNEETDVRLYVWKPGELPRVLVNSRQSKGMYSVIFDAKGQQGGIYYAVLQTNAGQTTDTMTKRAVRLDPRIAGKE